jgi:hypothetical protein
MSLRGCIWRREEVAVKPDCIVVITQNLPASNPTFTDSSFYHPSNIPLCAALLLSNPHSRSLRAAPRFSPTRFIPPVAPAVIIFELDCSHALGIKRYTLREENIITSLHDVRFTESGRPRSITRSLRMSIVIGIDHPGESAAGTSRPAATRASRNQPLEPMTRSAITLLFQSGAFRRAPHHGSAHRYATFSSTRGETI